MKKTWTTNFKDNEIAKTAHLMGKDYGMMPTDVLRRPAWDFWMNAKIRQAGVAWENEAMQKSDSDTSAGVASEQEKEELVEQQDQRAEQREQMDGQPDLSEQMEAMGAS